MNLAPLDTIVQFLFLFFLFFFANIKQMGAARNKPGVVIIHSLKKKHLVEFHTSPTVTSTDNSRRYYKLFIPGHFLFFFLSLFSLFSS